MPVARIIARQALHQSEALNGLPEQLRAAGYEVEIAAPGTQGAAADLVVELDELPAAEALQTAIRLARQANAELYVAPGVVAAEQARPDMLPSGQQRDPAPQSATAPAESVREHGQVISDTFEQVGRALTDARTGISDTVSHFKTRVSQSWNGFQRQRASRARERRLERERREMEREEQRRLHQLELQRRAEENQRLLAERERITAEHQRLAREQMAREAALRAERERVEREAMAQDSMRRAEAARLEEERRRQAALVAERLRVEQQARRAAAFEAERLRLDRESQHRAVPRTSESPVPALPLPPAPPLRAVAATPPPKPKPAIRRRRPRSARDRQWQRAAVIASIATLAAMLAFALGTRMKPSSPLPNSVIDNPVQQQIPFGPAKLVPKATAEARQPAAPAAAAPEKLSPPKPSPAKTGQPPARSSGDREIIADDEVIVHRYPKAHPPHSQTRAGVRHITDEDY